MNFKKVLASILAIAMILGTMGTVAFAEDAAPARPTATVTPLVAEGLTFALNFTADKATDEQLAYYGNWYADFELTVNKDVTFNANGGANGYLSGQYDAWSENWVNVPFEDVTLNANEPLKIMAYAAEMMGQSGLNVTYNDVYSSVQNFDCGVFFEPDFLEENPDLEVDLALKMYDPADETKSYVVGENYDFNVADVKAKIDDTYFMSLADAAAAAQDGDTIYVKSGTYDAFSIYSDNVTLKGWETSTTTYGLRSNKTEIIVNSTTDTAFVGVGGHNFTVEGISFIIPENVAGDRLWLASVIGYDSYQYWHGGVEPNGWDVIDCDFIQEGDVLTYAIFNSEDFDIEDCTFVNFGVGICVMDDGGALGTVVISNNTFTYVDEPINAYWGVAGDDSDSIVVTGNAFVSAKSADEIKITIDDYASREQGEAGISSIDLSNNTYSTPTKVEIVDTKTDVTASVNNALAGAENVAVEQKFVTVASIGNNMYKTLQAAIDAIGTAEGDYTITVFADIEEDIVIAQNPNQTITITGDATDKPVISGTVTINGRSARYATAGVTLQNLVFDATNITTEDYIIQGGIQGNNNTRYTSNLTVMNCDFVGTTDWNRTKVAALRTHTGGDHGWKLINSTATGLHSFVQVTNIEKDFEVEDCVITDCKNGINLNNTAEFTMTGTTMNVDGYGVRTGVGSASTTPISIILEDNTINAGKTGDDGDAAIAIRAGASAVVMKITSGTYNSAVGDAIYSAVNEPDVAISGGFYSSDVSAYLADGYQLTPTANGFGVGTEEQVVEAIEVVFEDKTAADAEGEKIYNINLVGSDSAIINRLNSGDLTFKLTTEEGNIDFTIVDIKDDHISVAPVNNDKNRYEFHFDTKNGVVDTNNTITIAQVKFEGYGKFDFVVDTAANNTNAVHTTKLYDNIVDTFIPNGSASGKGDLVLDNSKIENVTIAVPTRTLTINIDFYNTVENNAAVYQDMEVRIVGGTV
ncbi:MAG: hypothetical protein E7412_06575, partial [Ruminococcaceae bacterium]|nr:hypothetical protein [Oscillospiraceae bacterium]